MKTSTRKEWDILFEVAELASLVNDGLPFSADKLKKLNPFAVKTRYDLPPEIDATREEVREIVEKMHLWCKEIIEA